MHDKTDEDFDVDALPEACSRAVSRISCHSTKPGREVFVEQGNPDGWISTDETVEVAE